MRVAYSKRAEADLNHIFEYIARDGPHPSEPAARSVLSRIFESIERISDFPYAARRGAVDGTRELIVRNLPYIVV